MQAVAEEVQVLGRPADLAFLLLVQAQPEGLELPVQRADGAPQEVARLGQADDVVHAAAVEEAPVRREALERPVEGQQVEHLEQRGEAAPGAETDAGPRSVRDRQVLVRRFQRPCATFASPSCASRASWRMES